jgi:excisionase family DNA binding protein
MPPSTAAPADAYCVSGSSPPILLQLPPGLIDAIAAAVADRLRGRLPGSDPEYLTVDEVAERLRRPRGHVYRLIADGKLTAGNDGRRRLIRPADLDAYLWAE